MLSAGRNRFQIYKSKSSLNFYDAQKRCRVKNMELANKDDLYAEEVHVRQNLKKGIHYWFDDCFKLSTTGSFRKAICGESDEATNGYVCEMRAIEVEKFVSDSGWPIFLDWKSVLQVK